MATPLNTQTGEWQAWDILEGLNPENVCNRAKVTYDSYLNTYTIKSFGQDIIVSMSDKSIHSNSQESDLLLNKLGDYSRLSILRYLVNAKDITLTHKLIRPEDLKGGNIYSKGTHVLPLDRIADKYGGDTDGFLQKGMETGSEVLNYGDASLRLFPFPRVPVTIIIWKGDEEFSSRADLLLDSTCELHLPVDIVWSTAMMSVLVMLS
ncbi:MAG: DUF3786 domain-containing protein [Planctomycetota bacterium]|jgi:hypothetical protein